MPSRFTRFCCAELKEYKILDTCVIGVRREESTKRAARYKEPTVCRIYSKTKHVEQILPILEWTLQDVAEFLEDRKIKLAPVYYDEAGKIHYERRLGCLGCPLATETKRLEEFRKYPKLAKQWIKAQKAFRDTHPNCKAVKTYDDEYENFVFQTLKNKMRKIPTNKNSLFKTDYKEFLQNLLNSNYDTDKKRAQAGGANTRRHRVQVRTMRMRRVQHRKQRLHRRAVPDLLRTRNARLFKTRAAIRHVQRLQRVPTLPTRTKERRYIMNCSICKHYYSCPVHVHTGTQDKTNCGWVKVLDDETGRTDARA